jgi:signal transduction histidine kinase
VEADQAKNNFLAMMSHELRTPLAAITGYAGLLDEGIPDPATPAQKQHLRGIRANAASLLRTIQEILEFARLEAGEERVQLGDVNLASLVNDVSSTVEGLVKDRGLDYVVRAPEGDARLRTDGGKVRQILIHLVLNAVKFTNQGSVELVGSLRDDVATFDVIDTGIGVPAELQEKIFDPFFQAGSPLTREVGGTGIGLSVARGLARRLGGDVTVASRPGGGSTFTLTVPSRGEGG